MSVVVALFTVAIGLAAIGVGIIFSNYHHHKEKTLEDKMHNLLNLALAKISAAGIAVGHQAKEVSASAAGSVASSAASALHASEDEVAHLLRAAADKIGHK